MFQSIWDDVKREFNQGNTLTQLVIINVGVFVFINVVKIFMYIGNAGDLPPSFDDFLHFFCISSDMWHNATHPWVIFTSMFLHEGFWHILFNMLFLFWFGRIVRDLIGDHRILPIYILGGIAGVLMFFISASLLPYGAGGERFALGASAAVMAIVVASGFLAPDYVMRLLLIGDVKLKYVVGVLVFLDMIGIANDMNTGGHFAHLGGAIFGWFFVAQLQVGNDLSAPVIRIQELISEKLDTLRGGTRNNRRPRMVFKSDKAKEKARQKTKGRHSSDNNSHQERLDTILDKIKQSGYESLTDEEKEFLFNASKNE